MNKYEEAFDELKEVLYLPDKYLEKRLNILQELVEKATPQKPYKTEAVGEHYYACPRCGSLIKEEYHVKNILKSPSKDILPNGCQYCLQTLDWSDEE